LVYSFRDQTFLAYWNLFWGYLICSFYLVAFPGHWLRFDSLGNLFPPLSLFCSKIPVLWPSHTLPFFSWTFPFWRGILPTFHFPLICFSIFLMPGSLLNLALSLHFF
jgi:hypothetical protein